MLKSLSKVTDQQNHIQIYLWYTCFVHNEGINVVSRFSSPVHRWEGEQLSISHNILGQAARSSCPFSGKDHCRPWLVRPVLEAFHFEFNFHSKIKSIFTLRTKLKPRRSYECFHLSYRNLIGITSQFSAIFEYLSQIKAHY